MDNVREEYWSEYFYLEYKSERNMFGKHFYLGTKSMKNTEVNIFGLCTKSEKNKVGKHFYLGTKSKRNIGGNWWVGEKLEYPRKKVWKKREYSEKEKGSYDNI